MSEYTPVVIKATFTMVYNIYGDLEAWDGDMKGKVEFHCNDSSACMSRLVEQLMEEEDAVGDDCCFTCHRVQVEFVREATAEDLEHMLPTPL